MNYEDASTQPQSPQQLPPVDWRVWAYRLDLLPLRHGMASRSGAKNKLWVVFRQKANVDGMS
eukprot:scaffold140923_cov34-Tisochrysis_lutea.AAC.4